MTTGVMLGYVPEPSRFDQWAHTIGGIVILLPLYVLGIGAAVYGAAWLGANVGGWAVLIILGAMILPLIVVAERDSKRRRRSGR